MRQNKFWFTLSGILAVLAVALVLLVQAAAAGQYKILHKFTGGLDGADPIASLIFDASGNLYGTRSNFGANGFGVVFKLTPNSNGTWTESVLYPFTGGSDGHFPEASLIFDSTGNLYGTTNGGGVIGFGVVFKLKPDSDGTWTERILHSFANHPAAFPFASLIFDAAGNLYGTTVNSSPVDGGTVF